MNYLFVFLVLTLSVGECWKLNKHLNSIGGISSSLASFYHKTSEIFDELDRLHANGCTRLKPSTYTQGTYSNRFYTLEEPSTKPGHRLFLTFSLHGREYISAETALKLAQVACGKGSSSRYKEADIKSILSTTSIQFIPVVNKHGRALTENGGDCVSQRKNANRVDINRNFKDFWGEKSRIDDETYPGPEPMSEPETKFIVETVAAFKPHGFLDIHSGERGIGYPYASSKSDAAPNEEVSKRISDQVNKDVFGGQVWVGRLAAMGGSSAYDAFGTSIDYMTATMRIPYTGTWEIWEQKQPGKMAATIPLSNPQKAPVPHVLIQTEETNNNNVAVLNNSTTIENTVTSLIGTESSDLSKNECFAFFNPINKNDYEQTVSDWSDALFSLAKNVGTI
eukprot:c33737_g1_i1.p1 GENE.c33737_g1_i1~~c33737_g1_i1.p1  ORF type:complete len:394 (+),score=166.87 c33737_g1_i1:72-1253(+)